MANNNSMIDLFDNAVSSMNSLSVAGKEGEKIVENGIERLFSTPDPWPDIVVRTKPVDK